MINKSMIKDKQGSRVDRIPEIPAKVNYNGEFVLTTRNKGVEAELGRSLYDSTRRYFGVEGVIKGAEPYHIEVLSEKYLYVAEKLNLPRVRIVSRDQNFDNDVFFEYQVERNGQIYVCRVIGGKKTKTVNLAKVLKELDQRRD